MHLGHILLEKGHLTPADLARLEEAHAAQPDKPIHELILDKSLAKEDVVLAALAEEFGLELVDLTKTSVEPEVLKSMPSRLVHRRSLMPLKRENGSLVVAMGNPFDVYSLDELQTITGLHVRPVLASPREINRLIKTHFGVGGDTVNQMVAERAAEGLELLEDIEADDSEAAKMAQAGSVVKL